MNTHTYFEEIGAWPRASHKTLLAYVSGFVLSLALTIAAYVLAVHHTFPQPAIYLVLATLACLQFAVQIICFLHLGKGASSRDRLIVLCFVTIVVGILVSGSLWIMLSLNSRMMPDTAQMEQYMNDQQGI